WKEADTKVAALCGATTATAGEKGAAAGQAAAGTACSPQVPTDGLVGFLSGKGDATQWEDEYLWMNATVGGATRVANGFNLTGPASRIVWPAVGLAGAPAYRFAGRGLTVVATVALHGAPEGVTPLLGVGVSVGRHVCELSLWHDEKRRWRTDRRGGGAGAPTPPWRAGETYQVALAAKGVTGSAYVDGVRVGSLECALAQAAAAAADEEVPLPPHDELLYVVFFGGGASHVTLTNVFLYNRLLGDAELKALVTEKPSAPATAEEASTSAPAQGGPGNASAAGPGGKGKRDSSVRGRLSAVSPLPLLLGLLVCVSLL
ncbi:trans-sialidase, partial [Trypanosoma conorhini]